MTHNKSISIRKDVNKHQIIITHSYNVNIELVWVAHTQSSWLEKWWAPAPYKAVIISSSFTDGGQMHYYMLSPEGEKHYCLAVFNHINPLQSYDILDAFCDDRGNIDIQMPKTYWRSTFVEKDGITMVTNTLQFDDNKQMNALIEMGFEEGYTIALNQLYNLLLKDK